MIVCICNNVTTEEICSLIRGKGCATIEDIQAYISCCNICNSCEDTLKELLNETHKD